MSVAPEAVCPDCDGDYWWQNDYLGAWVLDEPLPICKECERAGLANGSLSIFPHVDEPTHLHFVAQASSYSSAKLRRLVTPSWSELQRKTDRYGYSYAIITDPVDVCYGDYILNSLQNQGPSPGDFASDDFFIAAWEDEAFELIVYLNRLDKTGTRLIFSSDCSLEDYCERLGDAVQRAAQPFVGLLRECDSDVVPDASLRFLYYDPERRLKWRASLEEVRQEWQRVENMLPEQYLLQRVHQ
jgi:hypothetical protein